MQLYKLEVITDQIIPYICATKSPTYEAHGASSVALSFIQAMGLYLINHVIWFNWNSLSHNPPCFYSYRCSHSIHFPWLQNWSYKYVVTGTGHHLNNLLKLNLLPVQDTKHDYYILDQTTMGCLIGSSSPLVANIFVGTMPTLIFLSQPRLLSNHEWPPYLMCANNYLNCCSIL